MSNGVSPTTTASAARGEIAFESLDPLHRLSEEGIAVRRVVAERAAPEVAPQIEVFELHARTGFEVAGEQRQADIVAGSEGVEQAADAGHDAFAGAGS